MSKPTPRVLVVDDSETQALKLQLLLEEEEGWTVEVASSASAALDALNRETPDLMVVDYHLPGMNGDELCRRVRMNVDTRGLPVLMLTVEDAHAAELRGLASGADDYLAKSVDDEILLLRLRTLLRQSRARRGAILHSDEASFRRARLLAIDDSPTYLDYLEAELSSEGYTVVTARGGREGLERLQQESFDCVLVDLVMPELDGIEVCRRINEMRRTLDSFLVVLMLTAHEDKGDMARGLDAGADDFVGKSSDMAVLKARIHALLRRKFFQEENNRILEELKNRELEAVRARAEQQAAEARAALAEEVHRANEELTATNRRLQETQVQLVQSEKMASLGQLVAGVAHEMNNPLAYALNNLFTLGELLDRAAGVEGEALPDALQERFDRARERLADTRLGLERVRDLVAGLRTFSRLDEGEFKTVDVHEGIDSVLLFLSHRLGDRIGLEKHYCPDGTVSCFAGQLNQVVMNLLANAIDAIDGQGVVAISTERRDGCFRISVRDSGRGIPPEHRDRIFDPFFTTKPVGQGTGLGLAISYQIVQAHHGEITIEPPPEGGTEMRVDIPLDLEQRIAR